MMKCLDCDADVPEGAYVCPKCGGASFLGSYAPEDAKTALDSMQDQLKAKEHVDRSAQLFLQDRLEEAIAELQAALQVAPLNPTAHGNMGAVLMKQGKPEEAIPWFEKALELNPGIEGGAAALAQARTAAGAKPAATESSPTEARGGCFIATACYGDIDCRQVVALRTLRDRRLSASWPGRLFIRVYYARSPALARFLLRHPRMQSPVRRYLLDPIVSRIASARGR